MKKILFVLPIMFLLAAGCNSQSQPDQTVNNPTPQSQTPVTNNQPSFPASAANPTGIFVNLAPELQQQEQAIKLSPTPGYIIATSILSHDKNKVVYAEISDCIKDANSYDSSVNSSCQNWKYNIFVKNLTTGNINKIYSYPKVASWLQNVLIKTALAGGCTLVDFPLAWSKNDTKIILELGNPTSCGSGGYTQYWYHSINPDGSGFENLAYTDAVFLDTYNKVVYTDRDVNKNICGSMGETVGDAIILKDIEADKTTKLAGQSNTDYSIVKVNDKQTELDYIANPIKITAGGCYDYVSPHTTTTAHLTLP